MSQTLRIAGCFCGLLVCGVCANAATHHSPKRHSAPVAAPAAQPAPVAQTPAVPDPPPPEEMPATPPKVVMSNGQLSINADNSTLGDVLSAVKNLTGATVEAPNAANNERVAVSLGPGNPQQVLQELFAGSKFDYIILGSPTSASAIERIILTNRGAGGAGGPGGPLAGPPNSGMNQMPGRAAFQPQPTIPDQNDNAVDEDTTQPEPPPPQQEEVTPPQQDQQHIGPGGEAQQGPKTPEQLLQELQRLQQQQGGVPPRPQR